MLQLSDIPELAACELATANFEQLGKTRVQFTLPENRTLRVAAKAQDKRRRRGIKRLIRPENARPIVDELPEEGERLHCVLRGDFVLCDLIPLILARRGACPHLRVATLGLSAANAETLANLKAAGLVGEITLVASHYFQQVDKTTTFRQVSAILEGKARLIVCRSHAKVILLPTARGDHLVIEGSANLRSSDNLEQMLMLNCRTTHDFHAAWIDDLVTAYGPRT